MVINTQIGKIELDFRGNEIQLYSNEIRVNRANYLVGVKFEYINTWNIAKRSISINRITNNRVVFNIPLSYKNVFKILDVIGEVLKRVISGEFNEEIKQSKLKLRLEKITKLENEIELKRKELISLESKLDGTRKTLVFGVD